ncbi:MAG: glycosyltransferase family 2 protein [Saccharofermentanales bacterium]
MDLIKMFHAGIPGILFAAVYALSFVLPLMMGFYLIKNFITAPRRKPKNNGYAEAKTRFAVLVPARNEESVITGTVAMLGRQSYPRDKFDIIVLADNCTDRTADFAAQAGALVFERTNPAERSKAHAMKWFFEGGHLKAGGYDAVCVVDADTILDEDFLREADRELAAGYPIVHGRCASINPYDSWTSSFMSVLLSFQNRIWHLPQSNLFRSGFFAGTGVCITVRCIETTGWNIHTLVEDAEFGIQAVLAGGFVRYCDSAKFYVEQVTNFRDLWKQQRRWRTGHISCLRRYGRSLASRVFCKRDKNAIAPLILVMIPPFCILSVLQALLLPIAAVLLFGPDFIRLPVAALAFMVQFIFNFAVQSFVLALDGKFSIRHWKGISAMFAAPFFYGILDIICLIKPVRQWDLMDHGAADYSKAIKLNEEPASK